MKTAFMLLLLLGPAMAPAQTRAPVPADSARPAHTTLPAASTLRALAAYEAGRKDPYAAFTWSLFLPGGGFFYLDDPGQGMACLGIEGVSVLWAVDMASLHPNNSVPYVLLGVERAVELLLAVTETSRRNGLLRESLGLQAGFDARRGATISLTLAF